MAIMVAFAQFFKLSADHNLVKNAIAEVEGEMEEIIQERFGQSQKRPQVQSSRLDLDALTEKRRQIVQARLENE